MQCKLHRTEQNANNLAFFVLTRPTPVTVAMRGESPSLALISFRSVGSMPMIRRTILRRRKQGHITFDRPLSAWNSVSTLHFVETSLA